MPTAFLFQCAKWRTNQTQSSRIRLRRSVELPPLKGEAPKALPGG